MVYELFDPMRLPCGGTAYWDESSGISYRCECGAVVGSIGMPKYCQEQHEKYRVMEMLGGKGWDYFEGAE